MHLYRNGCIKEETLSFFSSPLWYFVKGEKKRFYWRVNSIDLFSEREKKWEILFFPPTVSYCCWVFTFLTEEWGDGKCRRSRKRCAAERGREKGGAREAQVEMSCDCSHNNGNRRNNNNGNKRGEGFLFGVDLGYFVCQSGLELQDLDKLTFVNVTPQVRPQFCEVFSLFLSLGFSPCLSALCARGVCLPTKAQLTPLDSCISTCVWLGVCHKWTVFYFLLSSLFPWFRPK